MEDSKYVVNWYKAFSNHPALPTRPEVWNTTILLHGARFEGRGIMIIGPRGPAQCWV